MQVDLDPGPLIREALASLRVQSVLSTAIADALPSTLRRVILEECDRLSRDPAFAVAVREAIREGFLRGVQAKAEALAKRVPVTAIQASLDLPDDREATLRAAATAEAAVRESDWLHRRTVQDRKNRRRSTAVTRRKWAAYAAGLGPWTDDDEAEWLRERGEP